MIARPGVSVIIPCYEAANFLPTSIESVLNQSYSNFELLIVDDGSTDSTEAVVSRYAVDKRVKLVRHGRNMGLSSARNSGIQKSITDLIAFLDADDYWLPQKLELQIERLNDQPKADVCFVGTYSMNGSRMKRRGNLPPPVGDELYKALLFRKKGLFHPSGMMVRKRCIEEVGFFDESLVGSEDRDLWMRLSLNHRFTYIDQPLTCINTSRDGRLSDNSVLMARAARQLLAKHESNLPARFRYLMPRLRRHTYLYMANCYFSASMGIRGRRFCIQAILSSPTIDEYSNAAFRILIISFTPLSIRQRIYKPLAHWWSRIGIVGRVGREN